jgi:iodotyrosine deiodinase
MITTTDQTFISYQRRTFGEDEMRKRASTFFQEIKTRRSIREFSEQKIDPEILDAIIQSAGSAPSGANKQPWTFCVVTNQSLKRKIREAAEREEYENYHGRMSDEWLKDLEPLGTNERKEFLEKAPALIVIFKRIYEFHSGGGKHQNYYMSESVGIATGLLIAAIHNAGLCCLTHTPSPMNFLEKILERPLNERAFLLIPVGLPAENVTVPNIQRKNLDEIRINYI